MMVQNALPGLSWRPIPLRLASGLSRPSNRLGQPLPSLLLVEVVDISGKPVKDAAVDLRGTSGDVQTGKTDGHGRAQFNVGAGAYEVRATYDELVVAKDVSPDDIRKGVTTFLQFPVCILDPLIRPVDFIIFATAAGMIVAGSHFKVKALEMTGEIALGAAIFGFIYRLQCL
jgi:hypothetical protein